jgi:hypothetical protein
MRPRHFWILAETLRAEDTKPTLLADDRRKIQDMLNGNDDGGWW